MTRGLIAAIYGIAIFAILACILRWEIRRAHGRSAARPKPAPQRIQKALARWLLSGDGKDKSRRREAA